MTDQRAWRVGNHYGIHLYAENPAGDDEPIGTMLTQEYAEQAVSDHNTLLLSLMLCEALVHKQISTQEELITLRADRDRAAPPAPEAVDCE